MVNNSDVGGELGSFDRGQIGQLGHPCLEGVRPDWLVPAYSAVPNAKSAISGNPRSRSIKSLVPAIPPEALRAIAGGLAHSSHDVAGLWTQGDRRRYKRVIGTALFDAWLIEWSASSGLELHDHGGSTGAVAVVAGRLVESYSDLRWRHPVRSRSFSEGQDFEIPSTRVHEISNPGPEDALSVHVYSPPLRSMTFFDPRPTAFLTPLYTGEGDLVALEEAAI